MSSLASFLSPKVSTTNFHLKAVQESQVKAGQMFEDDNENFRHRLHKHIKQENKLDLYFSKYNLKIFNLFIIVKS